MKLSIITVCYNSERMIEKTIQSVLNQTHPVYEYIVIDGKSTDSTLNIIKSYEIKFSDKGINYKWISEKDKGISDAFNKGIELATGDLIGIINSDDELTENASNILNSIASEHVSDIYYGNCLWSDNNSVVCKKPKHDMSMLLYYMILYHPSVFIRKEVYDKCGMFDTSYKYCMDKQLLYRFFKQGKSFFYIDKELTIFKAGGISDSNIKKVFAEGSRMAIEFGEPKWKVKIIEFKKTTREYIVRGIKATAFYKKLIYRK